MSGIRSKVGPNGQLVIPEEMTSSLDWLPGAEIVFSIEDNRLVARKSYPRMVPFFYSLAMRSLENMKAQVRADNRQRLN
jgi:bifunctional DNA-binding transcriptional regulator/antitoxin component of YhaV-PrlF toxin-antitoxin module